VRGDEWGSARYFGQVGPSNPVSFGRGPSQPGVAGGHCLSQWSN